MPHPRLLALVFAAALAPVAPVAAQQVVEGRVVAQSNGRPLEGVTVAVVSEGFLVGTDSTGAFRFEVPEDRPGVALEVTTIGFETFNRTFILPLDEPLAIGLERDAVELEGIDVEVDVPRGWAALPLDERLEFRTRSLLGVDRVATAADLRAFEHQEAEVWDFFPQMTIATGTGCEGCIMMAGRWEPLFFVDEFRVSFEEFRSVPVGELCRVEVVVRAKPPRGSGLGPSNVFAYSCSFLRDVATGKRTLRPSLLAG
jgi:hypothetical protein